MNDDRLRALYAGAMARRPDTSDAEPVSLEAMVAILERRGSEAERLRTLQQILFDPRRRAEFELLRAVMIAGRPVRSRWYNRAAWRAAAGIVVVAGVGLLYALQRETTEPLRGGSAAVVTLHPVDGAELTATPVFVWHRVPRAVDYRLEVLDSSGAVVFATRVVDTVASAVPAESLVPGRRYLWSVTAYTEDVRTYRSTTSSFSLRAP